MKLNRKLGLLVAAVASISAGAAMTAAAQTTSSSSSASTTALTAHGHWHHRGGGMLVGALLHATKQLDLTSDQQQTIKTILSNAHAQNKANAQTAPVDFTVLANPGDPNYATAVQSAKTLAANRIQQESEVANQIYNVLTADQKAKLPQVLADMKAKFQQRRAAWQQRAASRGNSNGNS
jgi:Spy/CpxP family protein refolding chaperone